MSGDNAWQNRGRGRARGRSEGGPPSQSAWGPPPGAGGDRRGGPPHAGGGDRRGGPPHAGGGDRRGAPPYSGGGQRPSGPSSSGGNGGRQGNAPPQSPRSRRGDEGSADGRGAQRGRRAPPEIVHTKPDSLVSKQGSFGNKIKVSANYFQLASVTHWILNQYRVDFSPDEDNVRLRKGLMHDHRKVYGNFIFDGTVLYSSHRFPEDPLQLTSANKEGKKYVITVKFVKQILHGDSQYLQFFNIIMRKCLQALELQLVGRNFFDAKAKIEIRQFRLELWPGYQTSIRQHESHILLCNEITHKVMRMETVLDLMLEIQHNSRGDFHQQFKDSALGLVVLTGYNNRTYRIDDIDFNLSPKSTFSRKEGEISYCEYYWQRYHIKIQNTNQPLLLSKSKARELRAGVQETVYLVPELCRMTGLTDRMRDNFQLMKAVSEYTRVGPRQRIEKLMTFNRRLSQCKAIVDELKEWNMSLSPHLVTFGARVILPENIFQGRPGQEVKTSAGPKVDWTNSLRSNPMLTTAELKNWVVVVTRELSRDAQQFVGLIRQAARGMHMNIGEPFVHTIEDDRQGTYVNQLENLLSHKNPQLILCCASNNRADRYSAIKKKCYVDRAVPCQVLTKKAMTNRGALSIATKVAIQLNCKLGGAPWTVEMPIKGVMVVGFDVSHDTMNRGQSYGAMVASLNNSFSRYFSAVSAHRSGEELSNEIALNMIKALTKFREANNGMLPSRIIIYRDGVGDGQIKQVLDHEVKNIQDKIGQVYNNQPFRMSFVIVSKRINTRIFHNDDNPPPGTVVDDCITLPERYDFFIVSQSVRQGSVSPTSYNVIYDNSGLDADKMQRFTYKMTHLYYNWSGTVKVPAPVQYAHKLAMLAGQNLHRNPHSDLEDVLYYL